jgi:hydrogenase expression/formation protein HypE
MDKSTPAFEGPVCPIPLQHKSTIVIGHGSGGLLTHQLIDQVFKKHFRSDYLNAGNDFALPFLPVGNKNGKVVVSTDAHIVSPIFFPGGDIGRLAVSGTVNDVCMSGAKPLYITSSFILEEGFPIDNLEKIVISMQKTAEEAGVEIIAGDTKVVEKGKGDGIFISTTGIGWLADGLEIRGDLAEPGDAVIISGTLGDHGISVLSARGDLGLETELVSDVAPLSSLILELTSQIPQIHVLRDPTRGGLATTLNEIAEQSGVGIELYENKIPVIDTVRNVCNLLGFDPLYIANEGKVIIILPEKFKDQCLMLLKNHTYGKNAAWIGNVTSSHPGNLVLKTEYGTTRILEMLSGEPLPRIC